jgi:hypothetical protein
MKTCSLHESETIEATHLAAMLEFLPIFGAAGFCPGGDIPQDEDGFPGEDFVKLVSRFMDACYKNGFIVKFNWEAWEAEARGYLQDPGRLKDADLPLLRRLVTWHVRQNRFEKDHLAAMIAQGHMTAILRRLNEVS